MFDSEKVDYAIKENSKDVCDENRPYSITQAGPMSKFRKWHLREPKFAKKLAPSVLIITPHFH